LSVDYTLCIYSHLQYVVYHKPAITNGRNGAMAVDNRLNLKVRLQYITCRSLNSTRRARVGQKMLVS